ncbi:hypothetical protein ACIHCQ_39360 [Streptomyces sp. NPDC052236]|uniref:hypothetical protein n=1 Tax=Streptomyces sp. NPDC052236 TaxID=3365686 RepID=UPI0037D0D396
MCPETGRARLSCRRAEDVEDLDGWTLHRLRRSALTHDAEGGTSTRRRVVDRGDGEDGWLRAPAGGSGRVRAGSGGAGSPASIHPHVVSEIRWIRAEDFAKPAPVRYRSAAAVYDDGGADRGITRARGSRRAPPPPSSVTGSIVAANAYTSSRRPEHPAAGRGAHRRGSAAVNPAFTAAPS